MNRKSASAVFYVVATILSASARAQPVLETLVAFDRTDGQAPYAGLIADGSGNLYGTTTEGGPSNVGTVFKIAVGTDTLTTLATFNRSNGLAPYGGLVFDPAGNLYGTTEAGGSATDGTVFEVAAGTNALSTLANLNFSTGSAPYDGLLIDASGNLYGTTSNLGGANGEGTVFKVAAGSDTVSTLVVFNGSNGGYSRAGLIADTFGNLYGTTGGGGARTDGTVFKIAAGSNTLTTLATFNAANGSVPQSSLIADSSGNLYGTTELGVTNNGSVFKIPAGTSTVSTIASFAGTNGAEPFSNLIADAAGDLYGTAEFGGPSEYGTVFEVVAGTNTITTLATFNGSNGMNPYGGLIADASGNLFGTTFSGGLDGDGTVFELTGAGFVVAVPEPSRLALAGIASIALLRRRRAVSAKF